MAGEKGMVCTDNGGQIQALILAGPNENRAKCGAKRMMLMKLALYVCDIKPGTRVGLQECTFPFNHA